MEGRIGIDRFLRRFSKFEIGSERVRGGRIRFRGYEALPVTLSP